MECLETNGTSIKQLLLNTGDWGRGFTVVVVV